MKRKRHTPEQIVKKLRTASEEQAGSSAPAGRPGAIDAFKAMAKDLNA